MSLAPLFNPKKRKPDPKPAKVNLRVIIGIGLIVWGIAFLYVAIVEVWIKQTLPVHPILITCFGLVIGVLLMLWEFIYRDKYYGKSNRKHRKR
ncbi:MAG: DUF2530 domain-containing protein [Aeriscardovia sp.]|nr:DUF2530 domain-containing protein [Aeriscardovia sp.]MBP5785948.1 DUF2530 domain-containing protein [Aeriscardovia sp.]MBQ1301336.1 DUF2530 domain-containing protein [Aeriscardovia sp.]MBQ1425157.1 DUF2530 domain-containing protein [Aeriscardovia sp.]MBQ5493466.1 DUF2530 domain-containing protein [Aeriscardovia sp.]